MALWLLPHKLCMWDYSEAHTVVVLLQLGHFSLFVEFLSLVNSGGCHHHVPSGKPL